MILTYDNVIVSNNTIINCKGFIGGGIYIWGSKCIVDRNLIINNESLFSPTASWGGGIYISGNWDAPDPTISNNIIRGNKAGSGGGIFIEDASPVIYNNLIIDNEAYGGAGILCAYDGSFPGAIIYNNTICNNESYEVGGGVHSFQFLTKTLQQHHLWQHS